METKKSITPAEVRKKFDMQGKTITSWANERGYQSCDVVRVLNGTSKAKRGIGHRIAVELGLKDGVVV